MYALRCLPLDMFRWRIWFGLHVYVSDVGGVCTSHVCMYSVPALRCFPLELPSGGGYGLVLSMYTPSLIIFFPNREPMSSLYLASCTTPCHAFILSRGSRGALLT